MNLKKARNLNTIEVIETGDILNENIDCTVSIPTNQDKINKILSLKNNSIKINNIDFDRIDINQSIENILIEIPTTQIEIERIC